MKAKRCEMIINMMVNMVVLQIDRMIHIRRMTHELLVAGLHPLLKLYHVLHVYIHANVAATIFATNIHHHI